MIPIVRKQLSDLKELFLKYKWLASLLLFIFGLVLVLLALNYPRLEIISISLSAIGTTFIASGIITLIFSPMEKHIVDRIHEDVITTIGIAKNCDECRIMRVFYNRSDKSFADELQRHFKGKEILMMGTTTVGDFFGECPVQSQRIMFEDALKEGTKFVIILLDPTSVAAKDNAVVEEKDAKYGEDEHYPKSQTYRNIERATKYFCRIAEKVAKKEQIEVWYTEMLTSMLFIKTDSFTFIQPYVMRNLEDLPRDRVLKKHLGIKGSHGGYTPIFLVENDSDFAILAKSYFEGIKNNRGSRLEDVAQELGIDCQSREKNRRYI